MACVSRGPCNIQQLVGWGGVGRNTDVGAQGKEQLLFKLLLKGGSWRCGGVGVGGQSSG